MDEAQIVSTLRQVAAVGVSHAIVNMPNAFDPGVLERFGACIIPEVSAIIPAAA